MEKATIDTGEAEREISAALTLPDSSDLILSYIVLKFNANLHLREGKKERNFQYTLKSNGRKGHTGLNMTVALANMLSI